jgi:hypothetical protein
LVGSGEASSVAASIAAGSKMHSDNKKKTIQHLEKCRKFVMEMIRGRAHITKSRIDASY